MMNKSIPRAIAAIQTLGGIALLFGCLFELYRTPQAHNVFSISMYICFVLYSALAVYFGINLWRGREISFLPCTAIWCFQIPTLISNPLSFSVVTGIGLGVQFSIRNNVSAIVLDFPIIERHTFYIAGQPGVFTIGINFVAVYVVYALTKRRNAKIAED
jgi:hypothetical protein